MYDTVFTPLPSRKLTAVEKKKFLESHAEKDPGVFDCPVEECEGGKYLGDVILVEASADAKYGLMTCWKCKNVGWLPVVGETEL